MSLSSAMSGRWRGLSLQRALTTHTKRVVAALLSVAPAFRTRCCHLWSSRVSPCLFLSQNVPETDTVTLNIRNRWWLGPALHFVAWACRLVKISGSFLPPPPFPFLGSSVNVGKVPREEALSLEEAVRCTSRLWLSLS